MIQPPSTQHHPSGLSPMPAGSTRIAWHSRVDVQAIRLSSGVEVLLVDGRQIPLGESNLSPVQIVINLAGCKPMELKSALGRFRAIPGEKA